MSIPSIKMLPLLTNNMERAPRPPLFRPMDIATTGMSLQRLRMETAATNVANAETTRTEGGGPYRRPIRPSPTRTWCLGRRPRIPPRR
jgi:hypothetical protein